MQRMISNPSDIKMTIMHSQLAQTRAFQAQCVPVLLRNHRRQIALAAASSRSAPNWCDEKHTAARIGAAVAACLVLCMPLDAEAAGRKAPPITETADRCTVAALDKFADTRAKFSQEASGGNMVEAIVDVRGDPDFYLPLLVLSMGTATKVFNYHLSIVLSIQNCSSHDSCGDYCLVFMQR
jgi:hypothetical protein